MDNNLIFQIINKLEGLNYLTPPAIEDIERAENALGLKFADEYKDYISKYGILSANGINLTGLSDNDDSDSNVIKVTMMERKINDNIPDYMYVVEKKDGNNNYTKFQDVNGNIYTTSSNNEIPKKEFNSLADYLQLFINDRLRSQLIMEMLCDGFDYTDISEELDKTILLDEEDEFNISNPLNLIASVTSKKDKKNVERLTDDIEDLWDTDRLIDKLEDDNTEEFNVNINNDYDKKIDVNLNDKEKKNINVSLSDAPNFNNNSNNNINIKLKDNTYKNDPYDLNVNLNPDSSEDLNINLTNTDDNNKEYLDSFSNFINVKLTNDSSKNSKNNLTVKLKSKDSKSSNKKSDTNSIHINLTNLDTKDQDDKTTLFLKKRDELIEKGNPNMQLSVCLKIVVDLKKSLDILLNYIPNEIQLTRTKYLLGNMIDSILESSDILLKDNKRLKEYIYKIFDVVISINKYIVDHYIRLEDKLDDQSKESEDKQISSQLSKVDQLSYDKKNSNNITNDNDDFDISQAINNSESFKKPNINKKKI